MSLVTSSPIVYVPAEVVFTTAELSSSAPTNAALEPPSVIVQAYVVITRPAPGPGIDVLVNVAGEPDPTVSSGELVNDAVMPGAFAERSTDPTPETPDVFAVSEFPIILSFPAIGVEKLTMICVPEVERIDFGKITCVLPSNRTVASQTGVFSKLCETTQSNAGAA